jgi:hypothetical protein
LNAARAESAQQLFYIDTTHATRTLRVGPNDWDNADRPLKLRAASAALENAALDFPERMPAISPDGRSVAWNRNTGDSTTIDIWIRTPSGERRLTRHVRDDLVTGWLPDGSALVGLTSRWSPPNRGHYSVAVFDTATGEARQITFGPDHDGAAVVSPDGTRIAFTRESLTLPSRLCVTAIDGLSEPDCRLPGGFPVAQLLGWSSPTELILTQDSAGARPLARYEWRRNERTALFGPHVYSGFLSLNRRYVVAAVRTEGMRGFHDWIIPIDRPAAARRVEGASAMGSVTRWWEGKYDLSDLIDHLEPTDTSHAILAGISTQLGVRAVTATGNEVALRAPVRWRSLDTSIASVDSTGIVYPRARGSVRIEVSLAGWRQLTRTLTVEAEPPVMVLNEQWDRSWLARWMTFGDPTPITVTGPEGVPSFWNHGDGTYPSMAVLRQSFSTLHGLGVEVRMSTPIARTQWQRARTVLVADFDTLALRNGDPLKAPASMGSSDARCGAEYPGGDGSYGGRRLVVTGGIVGAIELKDDLSDLPSGRWWTLRVQILPDGRCGIAVNGKVVWLSPEPIPRGSTFWLRLGDESANSRLLHGPLQLWTGVRTDIDWTKPSR